MHTTNEAREIARKASDTAFRLSRGLHYLGTCLELASRKREVSREDLELLVPVLVAAQILSGLI
jgi:hypothetical protein